MLLNRVVILSDFLMDFIRHILSGLRVLRLQSLSIASAKCPFCGRTFIVKLNDDESGIRCIRCTASTVHLSIGQAIAARFPSLSGMSVCELSSSGPLVDFLKREAQNADLSEYQADVKPGEVVWGVRCEDVQQLTYADESFDLITHSEVMEHVPDDIKSFHELRRVLRTNGTMIFTVPLSGNEFTTKRAEIVDGVVNHLMDPVYHTDPWNDGEGILAFRDYGLDITDKLRSAGFSGVRIITPDIGIPWVRLRPVVIATATEPLMHP